MEQSTDEDERNVQTLAAQLKTLQTERDNISENTDKLNEQIGALASDIQKAEYLIAQAQSVIEEWTQTFGDPPQNYEFLGAIEALQKSLDNERTSQLAQRDSFRDELTWLESQMEAQSRIIELVTPLEEEHKEVACPVCKRPLTQDMVNDIKNECISALVELEDRKKDKQKQQPIIDSKIQETNGKLQKLIGIESKVRFVLEQEPHSLNIPILESHLAALVEQRNAKQSEVEILKGQITEKNEQVGNIEHSLGELRKRIDERERQEMLRSLTSATKGQFISQLFLESLESALAEQRRTLLEPLTEELSVMWSAFLGLDVNVELKDDAQLMMIDKQSKNSLDFPQLSGGEKTALLIFTQILLCKYFSNADFMLLDEPLEHLDAKNRWALIKFLVDTTKCGYPKQLIVTTVEETLLREYLDDEEIRINILSKEHPLIESI